jgi:hypothetical protein
MVGIYYKKGFQTLGMHCLKSTMFGAIIPYKSTLARPVNGHMAMAVTMVESASYPLFYFNLSAICFVPLLHMALLQLAFHLQSCELWVTFVDLQAMRAAWTNC